MADFDFVQSDHVDSGGVNVESLSYPGNVTAGNMLVVGVCRDGGGNVATVTKSAGTATVGAFTRRATLDATQHIELWEAPVTGTGSCTAQVSFTATVGNIRLTVLEYVGPAGGYTVEDDSSKSNATVTNPDSGNVTLTAAGLIVGALTPTTAAITPTAGAGFALREVGPADGYNVEDGKFAAGTRAATWTITGADPATCVAFAVKAAAVGGGGGFRSRIAGGLVIGGR